MRKPSQNRRFARQLACAFAILLATGCRAKPKQFPVTTAPTRPPVEVLKRPAIDLTRGGAGFPLDDTKAPRSVSQLIDSMRRAYAVRLTGDEFIQVRIGGDQLARLDSLEVDLSNAALRPNYKPAAPPESGKVRHFTHVRKLVYKADPLKYQTYDGSMMLEAADADLALANSEDGKLGLALTNCSIGRAKMTIDLKDLEAGIAAGSRLRSTMAFGIESVGVRLRSNTAQMLEAELTIQARVLMLPARFRLTGRADVDEEFRVHFSQLNAEGDDPTGAMIAAVVQAKLDKLNNKAAPLLKLPGDNIHITDLQIQLDDKLVVDVQFAGTNPGRD